MNKFKAWLIRKLGGYVLPPIPRIVHKTLPDIKIRVDIPMPEPRMLHDNEALRMDIIEREAARKLGENIIKNELFTAQQYHEFNRDIMRYTVRVIAEKE